MTVKWGIIGCGDVAEHKGGPALYEADNSQLTAVMRRTGHLAADFAERHGAQRHYSTVEDILADDDIDAVYVATPPHVHAEQTIAAAEAGRHVLCEKPMAMNVDEGRRMITACRDNDVQLMIAYYRRFWPVSREMKRLVADGAIGKPVMGRAHCTSLWQPPKQDEELPWRVKPQIAGGGYLWDIGSHRLDLLVHFLGNVDAVAALVDAVHFDIEVDDASSLVLQFANGAHGVGMFYWAVNARIQMVEIAGPKGRLIATDLAGGRVRLTHGDNTKKFHFPPPDITHLPLVEHFVDCILQGRPNDLPGEEGLKTTAIIEAAEQSADTDQFVGVKGLQ